MITEIIAKPCKKCGSTNLTLISQPYFVTVQGRLECECGAVGPVWTSSDDSWLLNDSIKAWNREQECE